MSNEHFKKALSNFTHEMGSAPEIRAMFLVTRNINKIKNEITFKVNDDRIRQTVMEYLLEKKVILRKDYINDASFEIKKVVNPETFTSEYIKVKTSDNVNKSDYVEVDFGNVKKNNNELYKLFLDRLIDDDKDYIDIIPWEDFMYHIKNDRIKRILNVYEEVKVNNKKITNDYLNKFISRE